MSSPIRPLVVLRPDPIGYAVLIEPPLANGETYCRTFRDKSAAWSHCAALWGQLRTGFRDETDGNVVNAALRRGPYEKRRSL